MTVVYAESAPAPLPPPCAAPPPAAPEVVRMGSPESDHPWRWAALYGAVCLGSMLLAHAQARGWL